MPFAAFALLMISVPYWQSRAASDTCYAVSDRRAIIFRPSSPTDYEVQSYAPDQLGEISRVERRDGSGDLIFEEWTISDARGTVVRRSGFLSIDRVREVEALVRSSLLGSVNSTDLID